MRKYFAYGSNIDEKQMAKPERAPDAQKVKVEILSDYEFFINGRGYASIREKKGKNVFGIIYNITEEDEKKLDICEGVQYGTNEKPNLPQLDAFYYRATDTKEGSPRTARKNYLEDIIKAAQANDFPKEYIAELKSWLNK